MFCGQLQCWQASPCEVHEKRSDVQPLFISSFTLPQLPYVKGEPGPGVSVCNWHKIDERIEVISTEEKANPNPSSLCLRRGERIHTLFAGSEAGGSGPEVAGRVTSFKTGDDHLSYLNEQLAGGNSTCYLSCRRNGQTLFAANYELGSVASFNVDAEGRLSKVVTMDHKQFWSAETVRVPLRQSCAHVHCAVMDAEENYLFACDLGCDMIVQYKIQDSGLLELNDPPFVRTAPGAGPRHLYFHPFLPVAYVSNELDSTMGVYAYDKQKGQLTEIQVVSSLHTTTDVETYGTSHIEVHPSGQFVVIANRSYKHIGDDSLALFPIDQTTGRVGSPTFGQAADGSVIRHFSFDPSGQLILAAYQDSGHIGVFRISPGSFALTLVKMIKWNGAPNWILFA